MENRAADKPGRNPYKTADAGAADKPRTNPYIQQMPGHGTNQHNHMNRRTEQDGSDAAYGTGSAKGADRI